MRDKTSKLALLTFAAALSVAPLTGTGCWMRVQKTLDITSPDYALENYRWFKEQDASLKQVDAQIKSVELEILDYKNDFSNKPRDEWPFDAREELARKESIRRGYISQYNMIAKDYNSRVSDFTRKWTKGEPSEEITPYLKQQPLK